MTDDELREKYKNVPTSQMIKRIFVLLGQLIVLFLKHILSMILDVCEMCYAKWECAVHDAKVFWLSTETQNKKRNVIENVKDFFEKTGLFFYLCGKLIVKLTSKGLKYLAKHIVKGCRLIARWLKIGAIAAWAGIIWTLKTIKDLIIHSKPTFVRLGKSAKQVFFDFCRWTVRVGRGMKLRHLRRKKRWAKLKEKGVKGVLDDMGQSLSHGISSYMNEEPTSSDVEVITEDDIFAEKMEENQGKAKKIGHKIFKGVKNIVEEK